MIRSLTISNFHCIRDIQSYDFRIAKNATDPDGRFTALENGVRLPRVIAIYGANASGKTTVLKAISFLDDFARNSYKYEPQQLLFFIPFLGLDKDQVSTFEVEFDAVIEENGVPITFRYELHATPKKVIYESLYYSPRSSLRRLFERNDKDEINAGPDFDLPLKDPVRKKVRQNSSVISMLAQFNHDFSIKLVGILSQFFTNVTVLGRVKNNKHDNATRFYIEHPGLNKKLDTFIQWADLGIESISFEPDSFEGGKKKPVFHHSGFKAPIHFEFESGGTQGLYLLLPYIFLALEHGGVAVIDELDAEIHPLLLPNIIKLFHDKESNPHNAQLIMSAHDVTLMGHLTKEEIYFTDKSVDGAVKLYGLKDIKGVLRAENFYAKYLAGVYGAVPRT